VKHAHVCAITVDYNIIIEINNIMSAILVLDLVRCVKNVLLRREAYMTIVFTPTMWPAHPTAPDLANLQRKIAGAPPRAENQMAARAPAAFAFQARGAAPDIFGGDARAARRRRGLFCPLRLRTPRALLSAHPRCC
jgi:hypothetical protein